MKSVIIYLCCIACGFVGFTLDGLLFPNSEMLILTWVLFFSLAIIGIGLILDRLEKEKKRESKREMIVMDKRPKSGVRV